MTPSAFAAVLEQRLRSGRHPALVSPFGFPIRGRAASRFLRSA